MGFAQEKFQQEAQRSGLATNSNEQLTAAREVAFDQLARAHLAAEAQLQSCTGALRALAQQQAFTWREVAVLREWHAAQSSLAADKDSIHTRTLQQVKNLRQRSTQSPSATPLSSASSSSSSSSSSSVVQHAGTHRRFSSPEVSLKRKRKQAKLHIE
jgi:hypothetical protein